ncbi:MAG: hypothetical protein RJA99_2709 [Pseudomonadota bacterium]|jgi:hypothetical protein
MIRAGPRNRVPGNPAAASASGTSATCVSPRVCTTTSTAARSADSAPKIRWCWISSTFAAT